MVLNKSDVAEDAFGQKEVVGEETPQADIMSGLYCVFHAIYVRALERQFAVFVFAKCQCLVSE